MKTIRSCFLFIICFLFISVVDASTNTMERIENNNYGVNKHWKMNEKRIQAALNTPLVDASEKIYDFSNILTKEEEKEIYLLFMEYKEKTGFDIVFVSDSVPYTKDKVNENYAADFYDYNDFGLDDPYYSGVILFRNTYEEDPYYGIYYFGEAQLYYTGERNENTLDSMYSYFKTKDYRSGIKLFVYKLNNYYDKGVEPTYKDYYIDKNGYLVKKYKFPLLIASAISGLVTFIVLTILVSKNKMIKKSTVATEYLDKTSVLIKDKRNQFLHSHVTHYTISSSSGGGGSSGGSHSGSSGGGHSGGGRHG